MKKKEDLSPVLQKVRFYENTLENFTGRGHSVTQPWLPT